MGHEALSSLKIRVDLQTTKGGKDKTFELDPRFRGDDPVAQLLGDFLNWAHEQFPESLRAAREEFENGLPRS